MASTNIAVNFGIAPFITFDDVSAVVVGESVDLCDNIAYTFGKFYDVSASVLNGFVIDNSSGSLSVDPSGQILITDLSDRNSLEYVQSDLGTFLSNSYKATISHKLNGMYYGDIGTLENDTVLSSTSLVTESTLTKIRTAVHGAITGTAIVSAAEDILRDLELSDASGTGTGRDTNNPFKAGDSLVFNVVLENGDIDIVLDGIGLASSNVVPGMFTVSGATFAGLSGYGDTLPFSITGNGVNVYIKDGQSRITAPDNVYGPGGSASGYYFNGDDATAKGVVLGRMTINIV